MNFTRGIQRSQDVMAISISDSVNIIKGIGEKKLSRLSVLGINTVQDLIGHLPIRYKDKRKVTLSNAIKDDGNYLVEGKLTKVQVRNLSGRKCIVECILKDSGGSFVASFFNMPYLKNSLVTGKNYAVYGPLRMRNGLKTFTNPEFCEVGSEKDKRGIVPVYRCTAGITNNDLNKWIDYAINNADLSENWISDDLIEKNKLCSREFAYSNIHFPKSENHYKTALFRIAYEDLLLYQIAIRLNRQVISDENLDSSIKDVDISEFINSLNFKLTDGQLKAINEIEADLTAKKPMNRLIQGDVGCGKTVVAEAAIFKCVKAGYQASMMAPTEILARQHFESLQNDLSGFGIKVELLISGMPAKDRRQILQDLASGNIDVIIGTHAIIQDDVEFNNLGLVITDEQHRFGVNQRKSLVNKGRLVNVCVMSATPIPRTLAATVFGDMNFTIIREKPSNRLPIITKAVYPDSRQRAYVAVKSELEAGHQAYVVAPSINSDNEDISSVEQLYDELKKKFKNYKVALIHGRLDTDEKDSIMNDFAAGKIDLLISTTVIEVGIDVKNASIIVIENSERFGLAQMHQLRGRVGRSDVQSYCYLVNYSKSKSSMERADAMVNISDGFEISEEDYRLRGPGDLMGTMQSGNYQSRILSLCKYEEILDLSINDANDIIDRKYDCNFDYIKDYIGRITAEDNSNII